MSTITTYTGVDFDPIRPDESLIKIEDIAHALSNICRANGHVKYFYSVAQHSICCYEEAKARGYSQYIQIACLLHDASEAYLSDVTRPIKGMMKDYLVVEDYLQNIIWKHYLMRTPTTLERDQIFGIDDQMLALEFHYLMPKGYGEGMEKIISMKEPEFEDPREVEKKFKDILINYLEEEYGKNYKL